MLFQKLKLHRIVFQSIFIFFILFSIRCASPGAIAGGPKDEDPPVLVGSVPENYAVNFKGKKVKIDFNEFLKLEKVTQEFNVSPPLKKKPKIWLKNKSVMIEYSDTLKDSTTYTFSFGNSILDNNEGNILQNFEFVFSTGSYVDSLGVRGGIVDAFTLKPDKEPLLVMLYSNLSDSAPFKETPLFTGRSNKEGNFSINNVKPGIYRLYGIKDNNYNYKYDQGAEPIAFFDSLVYLDTINLNRQQSFLPGMLRDTTVTDTASADTSKNKLMPDSMELRQIKNSLHIDMKTFTEKSTKQYIKSYNRKDRHCLNLVLSNPLKDDSLVLTPIFYASTNWHTYEFDMEHDSINIWLTDTCLIKTDTLRLKTEYWGSGITGDTVWITDTLNFKYISEEKPVKKLKKQVENKMKITFKNPDPLDLNMPMILETQYPITLIDPSLMQLTKRVDTIDVPVKFKIVIDSICLRQFEIKSKFEEQTNYSLVIYPGSIEDIYKIPTDTIEKKFSVQKADYYGTLYLTLKGFRYPLILQLMENGNVMFEKYASTDGKIVFDLLPPKEYTLKVVFDTDGNREFTNGDILKHRQPEKVMFYKDAIKMRSNWEMEVNWEIK